MLLGMDERVRKIYALLGVSLEEWAEENCHHWRIELQRSSDWDGVPFLCAKAVLDYDFRLPLTEDRAIDWLAHLSGKSWATDEVLGELTRLFLTFGIIAGDRRLIPTASLAKSERALEVGQ